MVREWKRTGSKERVIHQAEPLPVVMTLECWGQRLHVRRLMVFVDNEAAKYALIWGSRQTAASAHLVEAYWTRVCDHAVVPRVERVVTDRNLVDAPSRLDLDNLLAN